MNSERFSLNQDFPAIPDGCSDMFSLFVDIFLEVSSLDTIAKSKWLLPVVWDDLVALLWIEIEKRLG